MSRIRVLPLCSAVALALPLCVSAADSKDASDATALSNEGLRLRLSRGLNEQAPTERDEAPTYLSAYRMVGRTNEKIELYDDAEVRRGGAVLRGDTITYTFSTDEVYSKGNALVARNGTVFKGPELTYRLDAETGEMPLPSE